MNGGKFLEPESMYSFMVWHFLILFIFSVALCKSMSISVPCPSLSLSRSFVMLIIFSAFCYVLLVSIFYFKIVQLLLHPVVGKFSCHFPQFVGRIFFRCFEMSCFVCIVLHFVNIFLIFLLSPVLPGLFTEFIFLMLIFFFLSQHVPAFLLCFIIFDAFRRFLICVSSRISHSAFVSLFVFSKGTQIFSQTNIAPA